MVNAFGWVLFHNDWINQPSTHANVEMKKPNRLWLGLECLLGSLPNTVMTLWGLRVVMTGYLLAERWYRTLLKKPR